MVSSIRCLHWMDCTSYNVQCALHARMKSRIQFILFKLSLSIDRKLFPRRRRLEKFPSEYVTSWRTSFKSFKLSLHVTHSTSPSILWQSNQGWKPSKKEDALFLKVSSWFLSSSILPRCTIMYSCTVTYTVQWQWEGAVTS